MAQLNAIVDKLLTKVSNGVFLNGLIADQVLPKVLVDQDTGKLGKYGSGHMRIQRSLVGGRGEARRVDLVTRSSDTFQIEHHALQGIVTESDYRNVELPFDAEKDETMALTSALKIEKDYVFGQSLLNSSVMTNGATLSGTSQFSDYANSDPLGKARDAKATARSNSGGGIVNAVIMGWDVYNSLRYHPAILEGLGFTQERAGLLSQQDIAKALDVEKVIIGSAMYNSAVEGQTDSFASIWGKHMLFAIIPDQAAPYQLSVGYQFAPRDAGGLRVFKDALINPPGSKSIIVMDSYDLIVKVECGYLYTNAVA